MSELRFQPTRVAVGEEEGLLAFADDALIAVLVRLGSMHEQRAGWWFLEAGFGPASTPLNPAWATLEEAKAWLAAHATNGLPRG